MIVRLPLRLPRVSAYFAFHDSWIATAFWNTCPSTENRSKQNYSRNWFEISSHPGIFIGYLMIGLTKVFALRKRVKTLRNLETQEMSACRPRCMLMLLIHRSESHCNPWRYLQPARFAFYGSLRVALVFLIVDIVYLDIMLGILVIMRLWAMHG